jgi:hypothetical protein
MHTRHLTLELLGGVGQQVAHAPLLRRPQGDLAQRLLESLHTLDRDLLQWVRPRLTSALSLPLA